MDNRSADGLLSELEATLGVRFSDRTLLAQALRHSSYVHEQPPPKPPSNERLEFLGDAVVSLSVSHLLYETFPDAPEGALAGRRAGLVSEETLAARARELGLGRYVLLGAGEEASGGRQRPSLLCDLFEAVVGAIYLSEGWETADAFVRRQLGPLVMTLEHGAAPLFKGPADAKSRLQEILQAEGGRPPVYRLVKVDGPPHRRQFTVTVEWDGAVRGWGEGRTRKAAEQEAARRALAVWERAEDAGRG